MKSQNSWRLTTYICFLKTTHLIQMVVQMHPELHYAGEQSSHTLLSLSCFCSKERWHISQNVHSRSGWTSYPPPLSGKHYEFWLGFCWVFLDSPKLWLWSLEYFSLFTGSSVSRRLGQGTVWCSMPCYTKTSYTTPSHISSYSSHEHKQKSRRGLAYLLITFVAKSCLICCTKQVCWCNLAYITQGPHVSVLGLLVTLQDLSLGKSSLNFNPQYCLSLTVTSKKINLNLDLSSHKICT